MVLLFICFCGCSILLVRGVEDEDGMKGFLEPLGNQLYTTDADSV